jgi:hypothetical protein
MPRFFFCCLLKYGGENFDIWKMDLKKNIRFKIGSENWEMPLGVLLLLLGISLVLMIVGAYMGFRFGQNVN